MKHLIHWFFPNLGKANSFNSTWTISLERPHRVHVSLPNSKICRVQHSSAVTKWEPLPLSSVRLNVAISMLQKARAILEIHQFFLELSLRKELNIGRIGEIGVGIRIDWVDIAGFWVTTATEFEPSVIAAPVGLPAKVACCAWGA